MLKHAAIGMIIVLILASQVACQGQAPAAAPTQPPAIEAQSTAVPAAPTAAPPAAQTTSGATGAGTECDFAGTGATLAIAEKRLNFTCGLDGDFTIGLFGEVTQGDKGWEIAQAEIMVTTSGPISKNETTALVTGIVLVDGARCLFAGTGAQVTLGDQRLNFDCGRDGDYGVGLFGDIILGDSGWRITKGEIALGDLGASSRNVSPVLINALIVAPE